MYSFTPNPVVSVGSSVTCDLSLIPFFTLSSAPADTFKAYPFPAGRSGHGARRNTRPTALFISTDSLTWGVFASVIVSALERRRNAAEVKVVLRVSVSARTNDLRGREHFVLLAWLSCMLGVSI